MDENEKPITSSAKSEDATTFGCPHCLGGRHDGRIQVGFEYWYVCDIHQVKWLAWSNSWDWWSEELEAQWDKNDALLLQYKTIAIPRLNQ